jgi:hypothetical protein
MKKIIPLIILAVLTNCGGTDKNTASTKEAITQNYGDRSSLVLTDSLISSHSAADTIVTTRFLNFVSYLDSVGFNCDTNRLNKTYGHYSRINKYSFNNHFFYSSTPRTSGLGTYFSYFEKAGKNYPDRTLDTTIFRSCNSVIWYFLSALKPDQVDDQKWYTDAIIEEWEFKDSSSAKTAAKEIGNKATWLYYQRGAFVCYIDNYVYIMTSRSTGTMYTIRKPVFSAFAARNKVTNTNQVWR